MQIPFLRKQKYIFQRNVILHLRKRMQLFTERVNLEGKYSIYHQVKRIVRRVSLLDSAIEFITTPITYFFVVIIILFAIAIPFYFSYRLNLNKPLLTALFFLIPSLVISTVIYLKISFLNLKFIAEFTPLPIIDRISSISRWLFISALISGISTVFLPPLWMYLILTPLFVGVASSVLFLSYEVASQFILSKFVLERFYKKNPISAISNMFIDVLTYFDDILPNNYLWKLELAQLLGETAELMQKALPDSLTRVELSFAVSEISDPYILKIIEKRVAELAMTLRLYGEMILFGDSKKISLAHDGISKMFIAVLNNKWRYFEVSKSEELAALMKIDPPTKKVDLVFTKIKTAIAGIFPLLAVYLLQQSNYALSQNVLESVLPFILTWTLVSILSLLGSDDIIDKYLKTKSIVNSFEKSTK